MRFNVVWILISKEESSCDDNAFSATKKEMIKSWIIFRQLSEYKVQNMFAYIFFCLKIYVRSSKLHNIW